MSKTFQLYFYQAWQFQKQKSGLLMEENTDAVVQREHEINEIVRSIHELNEIFIDVAQMVVNQVQMEMKDDNIFVMN